MDVPRHTVKRTDAISLSTMLEDGARDAYMRPWHRIERGLRLNRLRIYTEELSLQHHMSKEEKEKFFEFLQKSLDKKLLNTIKVVQYDQDTQRIQGIKGLELKRTAEGVLKWALVAKKTKPEGTRKKKKEEVVFEPMKIEETPHIK